MGKIFDFVNRHKYPKFDLVIELMTEEDGFSRITNLDCLKQLFDAIGGDSDSRFSLETKNEQFVVNQLLAAEPKAQSLVG